MKREITEIVQFDQLVPGGQAIGELSDGRKVFAWGVLPGELAEIQLTKLKKHYAEAVVKRIIESSDERIEPKDSCYLSTSPWQIMTNDAEIRYKSQLITDAFSQEGIELPCVEIKGDGKFYNYRNKMEYSLWYDHDTAKIHPAFHRRASHQKIMVETSSIEQPEIWHEVNRLIDQLNRDGKEARNYQSIMIRCNQAGEIRSALFAMNQPHPFMPPLTDTILGQAYTYSPNGFFQINLPVYEMALSEMQPFIQTERVVDMYAGVGTIGLSIAREHQLTLVETDPHAFAELIANVPADSHRIKAIHAKSEDALEHIVSDATIIVDPPRAGLDQRVVNRLLDVQPRRIIYLSCNPSTQARDVRLLKQTYSIVHSQPFNFFPRTPHIEHLVVLDKS